jgi:hypothetical protein
MTPFPKIQRVCPYLDRLDGVIDAGHCRMCRRDVHDLSAMDEPERAAFLAACGAETCVSYRLDVKPAVAAAMIAASAAVLAVPAAAAAASHRSVRHHHRPSLAPFRTVPIRTAGMIAPVSPPPPPSPQKPD